MGHIADRLNRVRREGRRTWKWWVAFVLFTSPLSLIGLSWFVAALAR